MLKHKRCICLGGRCGALLVNLSIFNNRASLPTSPPRGHRLTSVGQADKAFYNRQQGIGGTGSYLAPMCWAHQYSPCNTTILALQSLYCGSLTISRKSFNHHYLPLIRNTVTAHGLKISAQNSQCYIRLCARYAGFFCKDNPSSEDIKLLGNPEFNLYLFVYIKE